MKIKKILYAAHLALSDSKPFHDVMELAKTFDAKVAILHVIEELNPGTVSILQWWGADRITGKHYEDFKTHSTEKLQTMIRETCEKELKDDPACVQRIEEVLVVVGYPADEILKQIDELGCDALIIGTNTKSGISHAFLGSVAERVLRRIRKPTIVLPTV